MAEMSLSCRQNKQLSCSGVGTGTPLGGIMKEITIRPLPYGKAGLQLQVVIDGIWDGNHTQTFQFKTERDRKACLSVLQLLPNIDLLLVDQHENAERKIDGNRSA